MLCLRCGKREQFADNLCENCVIETVRPVEIRPVVHGTVCPTCNKVLKGRTWEDCPGGPSDAACRFAMDSLIFSDGIKYPDIELSVDHHDSNTFKISGRARMNYKGIIIEERLSTEVRISLSQCSFCSKQSGNYFEAILQIRGLDGLSEEEADELLENIRNTTARTNLKDPNVFITKEEKVRGGYDFYMGENSFTRQLSQKLHESYGGETKWSSTLFGRKEGRDLYRHTYLVRLPGFVVGDYLVRNGEPLKVQKISAKVRVRSLGTGREDNIEITEAMVMRKLKRSEVEVQLIIVSHTKEEVQVLHPTTMMTVDLLLSDRTVEGETITGAMVDGDLFLV